MKKISIIVPIYKIEKYLKTCIESILEQTHKNFELILVDDGSPDNCGSICDEYAKQDDRIVVIHKENGGLVSARKVGLQRATAEYVTYVDGDDWVSPNTYEKMMEVVEETEADIVTAGFVEEFESFSREYRDLMSTGFYNKEKLEKVLYCSMLYDENAGEFGIRPNVWSKIFRKEVLFDCQMAVDDKINYGEDMACTYPAFLKAESVYVTDFCLYHYRRRDDSMTGEADIAFFERTGVLYKNLAEIFKKNAAYENVLMQQLNKYMRLVIDKGAINLLGGSMLGGKGEKKAYYLFPYELVPKGARVVIYGAGVVGQDYMSQLNYGSYAEVFAWVDKNYLECIENGLVVSSVKYCVQEKDNYDKIVIAILKESIAKEIKRDLVSRGIREEKIEWVPPIKVRPIISGTH